MTTLTKMLWVAGVTVFFLPLLHAQHYNNNWILSDHNGTVVLNFSSGAIDVQYADSDLIMEGASATISSREGDLLLYTNGCRIYNREHTLVYDSERFIAGSYADEHCSPFDDYPRGYPAIPGSLVIVPDSYEDSIYHLLYKTVERRDTVVQNGPYAVFKLSRTTVDVTARNGQGAVVDKDVLVDERLFEYGGMMLNRHANGTDWWLVAPLIRGDECAVYLIDSTGIHFSSVQPLGEIEEPINWPEGQSIFSPDGRQYLRFSSGEGLQVFDFDRQTGRLSNYTFVPFPLQERPQGRIKDGGLAVSPSGQFAYVSNGLKVFQYDLWAEDVPHSLLLIHEMTNPDSLHPVFHPTAFRFQLGPDCKIYSYNISGYKYNVIHNPDARGAACDFEQGGLDLGLWVFRDEPLFPNFRLGPLGEEGSPCAGPIVSTGPGPAPPPPAALSVFPNPASDRVSLFLPAAADPGALRWQLFDLAGRPVRELRLQPATTTEISLAGVPAGLYVWRLGSAGGVRQRGRLVVQ